MCVICHKAPGVDMPSDDTIRAMFTANPHGAGFAIQGDLDNDGGFKVEFHKGYMNVDSLLRALHARSDMKNLRVVIHTRIKTHGETDTYTTHPFKISRNFMDTRKTHGRGAVLFHNGVFTGLGGKVDERASDTQDFVIGIASRYLSRPKMPNKLDQAIVNEIAGTCRIMILYPNKEFPTLVFGHWSKHSDGCEYSNMNWYHPQTLTYRKSYSSKSTITQSHEIDRFGCNIAPYAWPDETGWIKTESQTRFDMIMRSATDIDEHKDETGYLIKTCKFSRTGDKLWYVFPRTLEFATAEGLELMEKRDKTTDAMNRFNADIDDEVLIFQDEEEALEFEAEATQISPFTFRYAGKEWYMDTVEFCAYTEQGIKENFKTGEQGHIKNYLQQYGCTNKYLEQDYPTEEDELDFYSQQGGIANQDDDNPLFEDDDLPALIEAHSSSHKDPEQEEKELEEEIDKAYGMA